MSKKQKRPEELRARANELRDESRKLIRDIEEREAKRQAELEKEFTTTYRQHVNFGGSGNIITAYERLARRHDLRCRTTTVKTGWFSYRIDIEVSGKRKDVETFHDAVIAFARRNSIPIH